MEPADWSWLDDTKRLTANWKIVYVNDESPVISLVDEELDEYRWDASDSKAHVSVRARYERSSVCR